MNTRACVLGSWVLLGLGSLLLVPACSGGDTAAAADDDDDDDQAATSSSGGRSSTSSSGGRSGSGSSSGGRDASLPEDDEDAASDAAAPTDLVPGDPCPTPGQAFSAECGECGTKQAYCTPQNVVGSYGACKEGTGSCDDTDASVADSGSLPVDAGPGPVDAGPAGTIATLVLGTTVGATTTVLLPNEQGRTTKPQNAGGNTFTCPLTLSAETSVYAYVLVQNPNATAAAIDLTVVGGGDSYLVVYPSVPTTVAQREACIGLFDNGCGSFIGPGCLVGAEGPTVPAGGSVVAYISRFAVNSIWEDPTLRAVVRSLP